MTRNKKEKREKKEEKEPLFPFDKMPYQEKEDDPDQLDDYELDSNQRLNLGESPPRLRRRTLREERNPGHEP